MLHKLLGHSCVSQLDSRRKGVIAMERGVQSYTCCAGGDQACEVAECLRDTDLFEAVSLRNDFRGVQRFVTAQRAAGV